MAKSKSALDKHKLEYEELPFSININKHTRKGGKDIKKMSKEESTKKAKRYSKSQGEHIKDLVIAVLVASIVAFALGIRFEANRNDEMQALAGPANSWSCGAEDEVVVIDGSCKHVDEVAPAKK